MAGGEKSRGKIRRPVAAPRAKQPETLEEEERSHGLL
jgi:hypothetical protein